ncbi:integumentary mucin C.1-like [Pecten maximus]|uniref:integumentary mucin C.1-like n=1 Tax=Pecten maximus TaxID=6579 RepID=UPI001458F210|nr:integumentary mucin C.1-like [Pecten maximus]
MDMSKLPGLVVLWIWMMTDFIGSSPSGPRGYRWSDWQPCSTGCTSANMRFRICEYQNNNGQSQCTPGVREEDIDPNVPLVADEITTTTETTTTTEVSTTTTVSETTTTTEVATTTTEVPTTTTVSETTTTTPSETTTTTASETTTTTEVPTTTTEVATTTTPSETTTTTASETTTTTEVPTTTTVSETTTATTSETMTPTMSILSVDTTTKTGNATTALSTVTVYDVTLVGSSPNTSCMCECYQIMWSAGGLNLTDEEAEKLIAELRQQLAVNVSQLSSTIRKKISVPDDRMSSAAMGYISGIVLALIAFVVIGGDVIVLIRRLGG